MKTVYTKFYALSFYMEAFISVSPSVVRGYPQGNLPASPSGRKARCAPESLLLFITVMLLLSYYLGWSTTFAN
jgi:hypothetical protein